MLFRTADLGQDWSVFQNLTLRELRTKYKRTVLGWGWSMLNPLATALIYTIVFGALFHSQAPKGSPSGLKNFALYLLSGLLPWNALAAGLPAAMGAIIGNASIIKKVYFPRHLVVLAAVAAAIVSMLIELAVLAVGLLLSGNMILPYIPVVIAVSFLYGLFLAGLGLMMSALNVFLRDLNYLTSIFINAWFFMTPIIYNVTLIPISASVLGQSFPARRIIRINPMARFIGAFRELLYDAKLPTPFTMLTLVLSSVVMFMIGLRIFLRLQGRFAEEL